MGSTKRLKKNTAGEVMEFMWAIERIKKKSQTSGWGAHGGRFEGMTITFEARCGSCGAPQSDPKHDYHRGVGVKLGRPEIVDLYHTRLHV